MEFYVFCSYLHDWRAEALHQLCGALRDCGERSYIWYTDDRRQNKHEHPPLYTNLYNVVTTPKFRLEDIDHPWCVWIISDHHCLNFYQPPEKARRLIWFLDAPGISRLALKPSSTLIDQCTYIAQTHCGEQQLQQERAGQPIFRLTDYIHDEFIVAEEELAKEKRIKQVVFNDRGGQKHIVALRSALPDVRFLGISQFPRNTISDLGLKSSVYLDLGGHTHLHRHLREMSLLGCGLIVSNLNVALSRKDLPLHHQWLINVQNIDADPYICSEMLRLMILGQFRNPSEVLNQGLSLRSHLRNQKQVFYSGVHTLIDYLS